MEWRKTRNRRIFDASYLLGLNIEFVGDFGVEQWDWEEGVCTCSGHCIVLRLLLLLNPGIFCVRNKSSVLCRCNSCKFPSGSCITIVNVLLLFCDSFVVSCRSLFCLMDFILSVQRDEIQSTNGALFVIRYNTLNIGQPKLHNTFSHTNLSP